MSGLETAWILNLTIHMYPHCHKLWRCRLQSSTEALEVQTADCRVHPVPCKSPIVGTTHWASRDLYILGRERTAEDETPNPNPNRRLDSVIKSRVQSSYCFFWQSTICTINQKHLALHSWSFSLLASPSNYNSRLSKIIFSVSYLQGKTRLSCLILSSKCLSGYYYYSSVENIFMI